MSEQAAETKSRRQRVASVLLFTGVAFVAASFVWPRVFSSRAEWSDELALKHQTASANLHGLTHKYSHELETARSSELPQELREAQHEFADLSRQLDAARARPRQIATALRAAGIGLSIFGAALYFAAGRR